MVTSRKGVNVSFYPEEDKIGTNKKSPLKRSSMKASSELAYYCVSMETMSNKQISLDDMNYKSWWQQIFRQAPWQIHAIMFAWLALSVYASIPMHANELYYSRALNAWETAGYIISWIFTAYVLMLILPWWLIAKKLNGYSNIRIVIGVFIPLLLIAMWLAYECQVAWLGTIYYTVWFYLVGFVYNRVLLS